MNLQSRIVRLLIAASLLLGGVSATFAKAPRNDSGRAPVVVRMTDDYRFVPATVTITAGQTVKWVDTGSAQLHTVADDPDLAQDPSMVSRPKGAQPFSSPTITPGQSFEHKFTVPGTYRYICVPHQPEMRGRVIVKPKH